MSQVRKGKRVGPGGAPALAGAPGSSADVGPAGALMRRHYTGGWQAGPRAGRVAPAMRYLLVGSALRHRSRRPRA